LKIKGTPISLNAYEASKTRRNKHFLGFDMPDFEYVYLPDSMNAFSTIPPFCFKEFVVDDNRSAVDPNKSVSIDGLDFYLSVKGIGSTTNPFSRQLLRKDEMTSLIADADIRNKVMSSNGELHRYLTGEMWCRGSPYGVQGLRYANIAMNASEYDDVTSIHGFRIAPVVSITFLPQQLQDQIRKLYWYRQFKEEIVQEIRLVPSNIRIYFHSDWTIGEDTCMVFQLFDIDSNEKAEEFEINFLKSGMAILTLLSRSLRKNGDGTYSALDFYDVWLDKDAVLAPDGTIFWADLEGLEWITLWNREYREKNLENLPPKTTSDIEEKMEYQIYRSTYELMYAYEQIERQRIKQFGHPMERKARFEYLLRNALQHDEILSLEREGSSLNLVIGNVLEDENLTKRFTILDYA
jgi:hypothetical protein